MENIEFKNWAGFWLLTQKSKNGLDPIDVKDTRAFILPWCSPALKGG